MSKKRIKKAKPSTGNRLTANEPIDYNRSTPAFSLERIQQGNYCFSSLDAESKIAFAESIFKRRTLTWREVISADRHGLGIEKIPTFNIKAAIPPFITEDKQNLLALRFNGLCPMVGYRVREIFYVLWFDHNMSLYDHG